MSSIDELGLPVPGLDPRVQLSVLLGEPVDAPLKLADIQSTYELHLGPRVPVLPYRGRLGHIRVEPTTNREDVSIRQSVTQPRIQADVVNDGL